MTDNQQASTLGCYGNTEIHSPHIDRLASQGMVFENAFCPNAFCSPCRASVLTGLMPSQHGVHSWIDDRNMTDWPENWHALDGLRTLPRVLQDRGYATALCGKYHLGDPTRAMDGFDHWCAMSDGHVRSFYRNRINERDRSYVHEGHAVDFFTSKSISFIERQHAQNRPFFLYLSFPAPYGHWPATREPDRCRYSDVYADCPMHSVPRSGLSRKAVEAFLMRQASSGGGLDYSMTMRAPNDLNTLRNYYAQISMADEGVGRVMAALSRLGLVDSTVLIFTADHGLSLGHHGFWGHGAATFPSNMHHAAHSIPLIIRHAPTFEAGGRSDAMVSNVDVFATVLDYLGMTAEQHGMAVPSRSLKSLSEVGTAERGEDAVYSENEETRVIRTRKWCYFKRFSGARNYRIGNELYDVEQDPGERRNLADDPDHAHVRDMLDGRLTSFFQLHARPEADLWHGGTAIQNSERPEFWRDAWGANWKPVYAFATP